MHDKEGVVIRKVWLLLAKPQTKSIIFLSRLLMIKCLFLQNLVLSIWARSGISLGNILALDNVHLLHVDEHLVPPDPAKSIDVGEWSHQQEAH